MSGGVDTERICAVDLELNGVAQKVLGPQDIGIGSGGGGVTRKREDLLDVPHSNNIANGPSSTTSNSKKRVRRHNHHHNNHHKKQSLRKRIRRNTQPAPSNTNEFLMKEHDHLFHLDLDNEDWDPNHPPPVPGAGDDLNLNVNVNHASYFSSSEDEDAFLNQDFSAMYDVVHQERLSLMSKSELITEYQLLEERVESLERKLKSSLRSRPDLISPLPPPQPHVDLPIDLMNDDEKVRMVQEDATRLREENRKLRADNKFLRKLFYCPSPTPVVNGGDGRVSTDSGGGSGSGSDTATPEERSINKMIKRL